tara:strand:- start:578 stop:913 length:336 start_codon:yes stop_codon:yes gene_type:complete
MKEDTIEINLNIKQTENLDEGVVHVAPAALGDAVKIALWDMFGYQSAPSIDLRGTPQQISAFVTALSGEKKYMDSIMSNGLDSPMTYKSKYSLENAISNFERETGLEWPIK